jgi:hypothetical protein
MSRQAIISPHTVGAISAYRMVIKDISEALGDPIIDMQRLFYAVMIQSGIERFQLPEIPSDDSPIPPSLSERISRVSFESLDPTLKGLHSVVTGAISSASCTESQRREVQELAFFLQDLYVAASFRRPIVTAQKVPEIERLQGILREDMLLVVAGLLNSLQLITVDTPLAKVELPKKQLSSFQDVLRSDLFAPYAESQAQLETTKSDSTGLSLVGRRARDLVDAFPAQLDLKKTGISALHALPTVIEAMAGKILGAIAKPFVSTLESAISHESRLLVYSFQPVWRQVWDSKLDKVKLVLANERQR